MGLNRVHETGVSIEAGGSYTVGSMTLEWSGDYVPVGDRLVPEWLTISLAGDASEPSVVAMVEVVSGVPRITELRFSGDVRQKHLLCQVEVEAMILLLAGFSVQVVDSDDGPVGVPGLDDLEAAEMVLRRPGRVGG